MPPVRPCAGFLFIVLNCGGNWNSNDNHGLFYFNANNSSSNSNSNYGSRLSCLKLTDLTI